MFDKAGSQGGGRAGGGRAGASPTFLSNKFTATVVVFLLCEGIRGAEKIGSSENQTTIRQDIVARGPRRVYSNILLPRPARGLLKNIGMFEKGGFGFRLRLLVQRKGGAPRPANACRARRRGWPHRCRRAGGMGCRSRFPDSRTTGKNCGVQLQLFQPRAFAVTGIKGGELFAAGLQRGGNML